MQFEETNKCVKNEYLYVFACLLKTYWLIVLFFRFTFTLNINNVDSFFLILQTIQ